MHFRYSGKHFLIYLLLCWSWLGLGWWLSELLPRRELWVLIAGSVCLGAPFFMARLYTGSVNKIFHVHQYRRGSLLRYFRSRRLLPAVFWGLFSLLTGLFLLYWFRSLLPVEWFFLGAAVPLLFALHYRFYPLALTQYKPYRALSRALVWSRWTFTLITALGLLALQVFVLADEQAPLLSEVMRESHTAMPAMEQSIIAQYLERYSGYYQAVKNLGLDVLRESFGSKALLLAFAGSVAALASIAVALSAFMVPGTEYRRVLVPLDEAPLPQRPSPGRVIAASAVTVVVLLFLYTPLVAYLEVSVRNSETFLEELQRREQAAIPQLEVWEGRYFKPGTAAQLEALRAQTIARLAAGQQLLDRQVDMAFLAMEQNVDYYLDWYYSLPAEYLRIGAMLTNSLEEQVSSKLQEKLSFGDPFAPVQQTLQALEADNRQALQDYRAQAGRLLAENEIAMPEGEFAVTELIPAAVVQGPAAEIELINLNMRAAGAGVGALSAMVASKVVMKTAGKGTLKLATQAMSKALVSKAGASGAGAAAGAALGSVVPGVGNLVGAVIGAGVGLVVGVSIDAALLKVEEMLSREEFREQILQSIRASKAEYKRKVAQSSLLP
ncbi:hypothetical protein [Biformimicrobium ophioploci]|uniref:Uncharacterized protein n=1 Tax=Biformimicrobium ophioploci TaxID=3036711 RepID=A0ABQ6LV28_9GAMM|nr:hypothetical protein [Microbulbifer sp. NKW57]GMG85961.1 hypothetical protein MNKW57_02820 [Microbulbifer sp. NKW57]